MFLTNVVLFSVYKKYKSVDHEVKGHRCIRLRSIHPSVSLPNLPGTDIKYEPASAATEGAGVQAGDQGQDGLHGLPGGQDEGRDGDIGQIGWQVCSSGF